MTQRDVSGVPSRGRIERQRDQSGSEAVTSARPAVTASRPTPSVTAKPRRRSRPKLSRRAVKATVGISQWWIKHEDDTSWRVVQIHRKDGLVELVRPGVGRRFVPFGELGSHYALDESESEG